MESFSTRGLPAARKVEYWNSLSSDAFTALEIKPFNPASFDGELRREPIGPLTLMDVRSQAVAIRHNKSHIARLTAPSYLLLTPLLGQFTMVDGRRPPFQKVDKGEYFLLDHSRPYELQHGDGVRVLCLNIPRLSLDALLPRVDAAVGRVMRAETPSSRILVAVLREIGDEFGPDSSTRFTPALAQGLLGIIGAAYSEGLESKQSTATVRRQVVHGCIESQLSDAALSPQKIAGENGMSTRRLRALLADGGESFSTYLLRRRLERSADMLRDPAWQHHTITDIAYRLGFNNATHFSYAFKRKYGTTPRWYRCASPVRGDLSRL